MKNQWKRREKAMKKLQNQFVRKGHAFFDFATTKFPSVLPPYETAAGLTVWTCWILSRYEFFEAFSKSFSHLGLYSNRLVKLVIWTDLDI